MSDEREFRIYVSSKGDAAIFEKVMGKEEVDKLIPYIRTAYPGDIIVVREIFERVAHVYKPDGEIIHFNT